jgi:hypothetical protein
MAPIQNAKFLFYLGIFLLGFASSIHYYRCLRLRDVAKNYVAFNLLAILSRDYLRSEQPMAGQHGLLI